jgi:hypothetical protein
MGEGMVHDSFQASADRVQLASADSTFLLAGVNRSPTVSDPVSQHQGSDGSFSGQLSQKAHLRPSTCGSGGVNGPRPNNHAPAFDQAAQAAPSPVRGYTGPAFDQAAQAALSQSIKDRHDETIRAAKLRRDEWNRQHRVASPERYGRASKVRVVELFAGFGDKSSQWEHLGARVLGLYEARPELRAFLARRFSRSTIWEQKCEATLSDAKVDVVLGGAQVFLGSVSARVKPIADSGSSCLLACLSLVASAGARWVQLHHHAGLLTDPDLSAPSRQCLAQLQDQRFTVVSNSQLRSCDSGGLTRQRHTWLVAESDEVGLLLPSWDHEPPRTFSAGTIEDVLDHVDTSRSLRVEGEVSWLS